VRERAFIVKDVLSLIAYAHSYKLNYYRKIPFSLSLSLSLSHTHIPSLFLSFYHSCKRNLLTESAPNESDVNSSSLNILIQLLIIDLRYRSICAKLCRNILLLIVCSTKVSLEINRVFLYYLYILLLLYIIIQSWTRARGWNIHDSYFFTQLYILLLMLNIYYILYVLCIIYYVYYKLFYVYYTL